MLRRMDDAIGLPVRERVIPTPRKGFLNTRRSAGYMIPVAFVAIVPLWLLLSLQNLSLPLDGIAGIAIKPFHLLAAAPLGIILAKRKMPRPPLYFLFGCIVVVFSSAWFLHFPPNSLALNYAFAFLMFLLGQCIGTRFNANNLSKALRLASGATILVVAFAALANADTIYRFHQAPNGHPSYDFIFAGGANLESSWVALLSLLFLGRRRQHLFFGALALTVSVFLASRIGVLLAAGSLWAAAFVGTRRTIGSVLGIVLIGIGLTSAAGLIANTYLAERVLSIGADPGSTGRFALWGSGLSAFASHPWGFGPGNAVPMTRQLTGAYLPEDNVHNVILQWLLDFGPLGAVLWLWIAANLFRRFRSRETAEELAPLRWFLAAYLGASLLQFRGSEPLFWFALGQFAVYGRKSQARHYGGQGHQHGG